MISRARWKDRNASKVKNASELTTRSGISTDSRAKLDVSLGRFTAGIAIVIPRIAQWRGRNENVSRSSVHRDSDCLPNTANNVVARNYAKGCPTTFNRVFRIYVPGRRVDAAAMNSSLSVHVRLACGQPVM